MKRAWRELLCNVYENTVEMTIAQRPAHGHNCATLAAFVGAHGFHSECCPQSIYERRIGIGVRGIRHMRAVYSCAGTVIQLAVHMPLSTASILCVLLLFADHRPQPGRSSDNAPEGTYRTRASPQLPWSTAARLNGHAAIYNAPPPNSIVETDGKRKDAVDRRLPTTPVFWSIYPHYPSAIKVCMKRSICSS